MTAESPSSTAGAETIRRSDAVCPVTALQNQYSIRTREPEARVLPVCKEQGIGFVPRGPLGTGFLTGRISPDAEFDPKTDLRVPFPRFSKENMKANMPLAEMLSGIAAKKGVSTLQIALGGLLTREDLEEIEDGLSRIEIKEERLSKVLVDDIHETM